eukprot:365042-Chlamydomonas_euryale.AAC.35
MPRMAILEHRTVQMCASAVVPSRLNMKQKKEKNRAPIPCSTASLPVVPRRAYASDLQLAAAKAGPPAATGEPCGASEATCRLGLQPPGSPAGHLKQLTDWAYAALLPATAPRPITPTRLQPYLCA